MQNRYAGDIGDFGKLGLLRALRAAGLSIGVNWYLTPDETHNGDGRYVEYLSDEYCRQCDEELWIALKRMVDSGRRNVSELQSDRVLEAVFYSETLDFSGKSKSDRARLRDCWHRKAVRCLSGVDLVFADPDNGLVVPSAAGSKRENKYVLPKELEDYYRQGASVVYYQHKARKPDSFYTSQHDRLLDRPEFSEAITLGLKFRKTSLRYYFFFLHPAHQAVVNEAVDKMLKTSWKSYFSKLQFFE